MIRKDLAAVIVTALTFFLAVTASAGTMVIGLELGETSKTDAISTVKAGSGTVLRESLKAPFEFVAVKG